MVGNADRLSRGGGSRRRGVEEGGGTERHEEKRRVELPLAKTSCQSSRVPRRGSVVPWGRDSRVALATR